MRNKTICSLFFLIICESSLVSQSFTSRDLIQGNPALQDSAEGNKYNFSQFAQETWSFIKQPAKWDGSDWLKLGLIGGGAFVVMQADQPIRDAIQEDQKYYKSVPIELGKMWADIYPPVLLFGGFAVHSLLTDDIRTKKIAFEIAQAMLYAGAADKLIAIIVGRARPYANEGSRSFHLFSSFFPIPEYQSLPGGHNTIAFALSTVLSRNAGPLWLKIAAYVPAGLTFVSRVYQDRHWASDNVLGAALGYFVATWVVDLHEREDSRFQISSVYPLTNSITLN
jgi:membrane-associated phospholipid phosphatase